MHSNSYCRCRDCSLTASILPALPYVSCKMSHISLDVVAFEIFWKTVANTHWCNNIRALQSSLRLSLYAFFVSSVAFLAGSLQSFLYDIIHLLETKNGFHLDTPITIACATEHRQVTRNHASSSHEANTRSKLLSHYCTPSNPPGSEGLLIPRLAERDGEKSIMHTMIESKRN